MRCLFLLCSLAGLLPAQTVTDHLKGKVLDDSSRVVVGATISVTRGPDRALKHATTDGAGRWIVDFENGTGDYLVAVSMTGFRTARRRVQAEPGQHELVVDFTLGRDLATLAAVKVQAKKPETASNNVSPFGSDVGASEKWADGIEGQLSPSLAGSISALAGTMPGLTSGANGLSFMGGSSESNLTTLNGMSMPGGSLPRAARVDTRVTGTTYDATRGGFSGANVDVRLGGGSRFYQQRNAYLTVDPSAWQRTDAIGRSTGAVTGNVRASVGADGELIRHALTYNVALDFAHSTSTLATLGGEDVAAWQRAGAGADSVRRLRDVARALGIPLTGAASPDGRERTGVTWLGRLDDTRDSLHARTLTTIAASSREGAVGFAPLTAPMAGGARREQSIGVQLQSNDFVGPGHRVLSQSKLAANATTNATDPYLRLPGAAVTVRSGTGGAADVATLQLGGGAGLQSEDRRWTVEGGNETIWLANGRTHRFKAALWGRADGLSQSGIVDDAGRFGFASLADFAANRPSTFSRTLGNRGRDGTAWNAASAFAHQWNKSRWFNLIYGARVEAGGIGAGATRNEALEQALGVQSGNAPVSVHVSPRFGFQWTYNRAKDNGNGQSNNQMGRFYRTTSGVIRGGIGEFRDLVRPGLAADASALDGSASSAVSLRCIGATVPTPDWAGMLASASAIPSQCVGTNGELVERAPTVALIDPHWAPARSWRTSLEWNANRGRLMWKLSGVASLDLDQPGLWDANFAGTPRFALGGGDGRPVFVPSSAIDAGSGAVSAVDARRSASYGSVGVRTSSLRGWGEQVTLSLTPDPFQRNRSRRPFLGGLYTSVAYTWQRSMRQARGFDGAGYGDPRAVEWAPSASDARHIVVVQGGMPLGNAGVLTLFARLQSGLPFTPVVQGDIDGDGRGGDRAVIPRAGNEGDPAVAAGLAALRASGSDAARECLAKYDGRVAARNGCRGPWTSTLNAQWRVFLPKRWNRLTASVYFDNVLAGVDQAVHGASGMKGWGAPTTPDPVLFIPKGFDANARTFRYDVNPRFADTRPATTLLRAPFRVTLDFSLRLSTDFDLQQLRRAMEPVRVERRWTRRGADSLTAFFLENTSNLHAMLLAESDSLFLTPSQVQALREADSVFTSGVRGIFRPLGQYLAQFKDGEAPREALDTVAAAQKQYWKLFWLQPEKADSIVTPIQRELMPLLSSIVTVPQREREHSQWQFGYPVVLVDRPRKK